jgi:hypothetical protein
LLVAEAAWLAARVALATVLAAVVGGEVATVLLLPLLLLLLLLLQPASPSPNAPPSYHATAHELTPLKAAADSVCHGSLLLHALARE